MLLFQILEEMFGPGESECLLLAKELKASLLLIDEQKGRKMAKKLGLRITGTVGVLARAAEKKLLPEEKLAPSLRKLQKSGFRLSEDLIEQFLER